MFCSLLLMVTVVDRALFLHKYFWRSVVAAINGLIFRRKVELSTVYGKVINNGPMSQFAFTLILVSLFFSL